MSCEVDDTLFQPRRGQMLATLVTRGLLQPRTHVNGNVTTPYVAFTNKGHMAYCNECSKRYPDVE